MKQAFFNTRYQDHPEDESSDCSPIMSSPDDRFEEIPINYNENYLYEDENADRWNSGPDPKQVQGQPKGKPLYNEPKKELVNTNRVFDEDDTIKSFKKQEQIISQIVKSL